MHYFAHNGEVHKSATEAAEHWGSSGSGKIFLIVAITALIAGLVYYVISTSSKRPESKEEHK